MKRIIFASCLAIAMHILNAQTNIFPVDGNVGIGTTNPQSSLQIGTLGSGNSNAIVLPGVYNYERVKLGQYGNGNGGLEFVNHVSLNDSYGIRFLTNSDEAIGLQIQYSGYSSSYNNLSYTTGLYMGLSGNVGIGTTTPLSKLTVNPNGAGGITIGNPSTGTGGYTSLIMNISASQNGYASIASVKASGSELGVLSLNPEGGNVGIGTTTPNEKLAVNGKIRAKEIKVENANWPDYVFKEDYKLKPLSQIEAYIKEHEHLEDMPSAAVVAKEGIELGANQAMLLKKIEELTLHLIEMEKKLEKQNEKIKQQEKTNDEHAAKIKKLESLNQDSQD